MALSKRNYIANETVITAANLNAIQDSVIANETAIAGKITKPAETPAVGKILKIKTVNSDGTFVCEWADESGSDSSTDVQINGTSITENGVANIPVAAKDTYGAVKFSDTWATGVEYENGIVKMHDASTSQIDSRYNNNCGAIMPKNLVYAVNSVLCSSADSEALSDEQKAAARSRIGVGNDTDISGIEDVLEISDDPVDVAYSWDTTYSSGYWYINDKGEKKPLSETSASAQTITKTIHLKKGETIIATTKMYTNRAAIAKYVDGNTYTILALGLSQTQYKEHTYTATEDCYVVVSCFGKLTEERPSFKIQKVSNGSPRLDRIETAAVSKIKQYYPETTYVEIDRMPHDCTFIGEDFVSFNKPSDGGGIKYFDTSNWTQLKRSCLMFYEENGKELQMKSVDYKYDKLLVGNGRAIASGETSYTDQGAKLYVFYEADTWKSATSNMDSTTCGSYSVIDVSALGYKVYGFWGSEEDVVFVSCNLFHDVYMIELEKSNDVYTGNYSIIDFWHNDDGFGDFSGHGGQMYNGELYIATNDPDLCTVYKCVLQNNHNLSFEAINLSKPPYNSLVLEQRYIDGMCIKDGKLYAQPLYHGSNVSNTYTGLLIADIANAGIINSSNSSSGISDVRINGTSILSDGIANIPKATSNTLGVVSASNGLLVGTAGNLFINCAPDSVITGRDTAPAFQKTYMPIVPSNLDLAVKAAITDGKGTVWTATQKEAARERIGADNWEVIAFGKTTETSLRLNIDTDVNGNSFGLRKYRFFVMNAPKISDETYGTYAFLEENNMTSGTYNRPAPYTNVVKPPDNDYYNGCLIEMECVGEATRMYKVTRASLAFHRDSLVYGDDLKSFSTGANNVQVSNYLQTGYTNQENGITQVGVWGTGTAYFPSGTVYYLLGVRM